LYASKADYNVEEEPEPEPESQSFANICSEIWEALERYVASQAAKIDINSEPPVLVKTEVAAESEPELGQTVVNKPEPEKEEPIVETSADLPVELAMKLVPSSPAMRVPLSLRSLDINDRLQIFIKVIDSQEVGFLMVQSTVGPVFIRDDLPRHAAYVLFEVPSNRVVGHRNQFHHHFGSAIRINVDSPTTTFV